MVQLELSVMSRGPTTIDDLGPLLSEFEAQNRARIQLRVLDWDTAWGELIKVALYQHGPDVSEIGSTWLGSFVGMHALRPFADDEILTMGGSSAFLPSSWQSGMMRSPMTKGAVSWAILSSRG
jgi:hypothetical protein